MTTGHRQVELSFEGEPVAVDAGLADLLPELWTALGLCTLNSCEDSGGFVELQFLRGDDASRFLAIAMKEAVVDFRTRPESGHLYLRILGRANESGDPPWEYIAWPVDFADIESEDDPLTSVTIFVRFPHCDYADVLRSFRRHNGTLPAPQGDQLSFDAER